MPFAGAHAIKCRRGTNSDINIVVDYRSGHIRFLFLISGSVILLGLILIIPAISIKWNELLFSAILLIITGFISLIVTCVLFDNHQRSKIDAVRDANKTDASKGDADSEIADEDKSQATDESFINFDEKY